MIHRHAIYLSMYIYIYIFFFSYEGQKATRVELFVCHKLWHAPGRATCTATRFTFSRPETRWSSSTRNEPSQMGSCPSLVTDW